MNEEVTGTRCAWLVGVGLVLVLSASGCDDKVLCPGAAYPRSRGQCAAEADGRSSLATPTSEVTAKVIARTEVPESVPATLLEVALENTSTAREYHVKRYRFIAGAQGVTVDADVRIEPGAKLVRKVRLGPGAYEKVDVAEVRVEIVAEPIPAR